MKEMQEFLRHYQREMNWEIHNGNYEEAKTSLLNNYMLLTTEVGEIAEEFRAIFNFTKLNSVNNNTELAFTKAKKLHKEDIGKEIADCLAYLIKFANYFEIDIEESFYAKMEEIKHRKNKDTVIK